MIEIRGRHRKAHIKEPDYRKYYGTNLTKARREFIERVYADGAAAMLDEMDEARGARLERIYSGESNDENGVL